MRDILMNIYNVLIKDTLVQQYVDNRIKFYEYPEPSDMTKPYIVMSEIDDTLPVEYADNDNMALSYLVQIDVFVPESEKYQAYFVRNKVSYHISRLMKEELKMENTSNAKPEYDEESKMYRSARRYEGTFYRTELNL
ncbi:TPA: hypothetical protein LQO20_001207 [Staphylococcus pseudintermedius]|uniref:hypothetical protein n=1 Tax=Staphylococcus pseudintermedius TaxID=283734 RepID=UPI0018EF3A6F|nr:hypothetical protein [Staphylococcus pseudintermedius]EGQ1599336.1 hypothetical protein [Staphylococcus pseudintermedius]EGQ3529077.1 hypothetical protein [Staphylococcus pseudintermedius]EGQ4017330.1 hypothetical protein [Staphylococcus pseudintermedius]EIK0289796.1 hypothetical protein [Staphylococcus pseudintermedius]EIM5192024.1 hypothetical protein [Staphylococcus pseudintermedius]